MDKKYLTNVMTSGEAAMQAINQYKFGKKFFHLGPPRDSSLFEKIKDNLTSIDNCDFILCTGLFDEDDPDLNKKQLHENDMDYYKNFLASYSSKKLICTNPDLIVDRGNVRELCAGSVAMVFEKMGGKVVYFGKPYPEVYNNSIENLNKKVLSIGDNLNTDIKGANLLNFDSLLISNGVHRQEIKEKRKDKGIEDMKDNVMMKLISEK